MIKQTWPLTKELREERSTSKAERHTERRGGETEGESEEGEKSDGDGGEMEIETERGKETEYLCAEQKGVQSIIFRQADRAVWGVYFYLTMREGRGVWIRDAPIVKFGADTATKV